MNTLFFFSQPLIFTHSLCLLALISYLTALATITQWTSLVPVFFLGAFIFIAYKKAYSFIPLLTFMLLISLTVITRVWQSYTHYYAHQELLHQPVMVQGVVTNIQYTYTIQEQSTLTLETTLIQSKKCSFKKPLKINLFTHPQHTKNISLGSKIEIKDIVLSKPVAQSNFETYLIKEDIWATAKTNPFHHISIIQHSNSYKKSFMETLQKNFSVKTKILFNAIFLGQKEKSKELTQVQHSSLYWGISHLMARSGIHLVVLFGLFMLLFHYVQLAYFLRYILCFIILIGYCHISIASISFIRALYMLLLHIAGWISNNLTSSLHAACLVSIATIIYNPLQILFLDFQLSFGITYIIIWLFIFKKSKTVAF